jgi:predicted RecA/RadA family phage recombinase
MSQFGGGKSPGDGVNESPGGDIGDGFLDTRFDTFQTDTTDSTDSDGPEGDGMATFIQDGDAVDYTPGADVAAGEVVVQGDLVGVAKTPIAAGTLGSLATRGVFDFPKAGAGAIASGAVLYWDATNGVATTTASGNKRIGKAVAAAAAADTAVRGLLAP